MLFEIIYINNIENDPFMLCKTVRDIYGRSYTMCIAGANQLTISIVKVKPRENNYLMISFVNFPD